MPTLAETLAAYAVGERSAPLSDEVRHHARRALIDWFAALQHVPLIHYADLRHQLGAQLRRKRLENGGRLE